MKGGRENAWGGGGVNSNPRIAANKKLINTNFLVVLSLILALFSVLPLRGLAQGAKIYLSPNGGSFAVDSTFDVSVFVDTGGDAVNAVDVKIKFSPDKLQIINPSAGTSFISLWLQQPIFLLIFGNFSFAAGESLELNSETQLNLNPLDAVNRAGVGGIGVGDVLDAFKFNFPFDPGNININTNVPISPKANESQGLPGSDDIDLKQFLTPKDISSDDLGGAVKAVATLIIEIFLVVISITSQVLNVILGFLR